MAKKNEQKKGVKEINKKSKKIKEKIMSTVETKLENEQTNDLETDQKKEQIIDPEIVEKQPENKPMDDVGADELIKVLNIPMESASNDGEVAPVHSAMFGSEDEPELEEEEEEEMQENLNDRYFGEKESRSEDDFDNDFFTDEKLMAEMGVEVIDLGMTTLAQFLAGDWDNPEKYAVSDYKKNKLKKPLEALLRSRGAKVSPEVMFGVVLLVVYSPMMVLAMQERKKKKEEERKKAQEDAFDPANEIPSHIQQVRPVADTQTDLNAPKPLQIPKKKGRPKGSKDTKKRSTKGYKGNTNAK